MTSLRTIAPCIEARFDRGVVGATKETLSRQHYQSEQQIAYRNCCNQD